MTPSAAVPLPAGSLWMLPKNYAAPQPVKVSQRSISKAVFGPARSRLAWRRRLDPEKRVIFNKLARTLRRSVSRKAVEKTDAVSWLLAEGVITEIDGLLQINPILQPTP